MYFFYPSPKISRFCFEENVVSRNQEQDTRCACCFQCGVASRACQSAELGNIHTFYNYIESCTHSHTHLCMFICLSLNMKKPQFTLIPLIPVQHRKFFSPLPFCVCIFLSDKGKYEKAPLSTVTSLLIPLVASSIASYLLALACRPNGLPPSS